MGSFEFTNESIAQAIKILNQGKEVKTNSRTNKVEDIKKLQSRGINLIPSRSRYLRNKLPYPWYKLCKILLKYITLDGHHVEIYGHHIILLNHFKFFKERVNLVNFVRFSMILLMEKYKKNTKVAYDGFPLVSLIFSCSPKPP